MDMAKHGSLLTKMTAMQRRFSEEETRTIMIQLLLTVDLMHRNGMIHRDIKLDNVLILEEDTLDICIADLGMACRATDLS
jgi:calcium/calmodulin-dependent protein kinase I